MMRLRSLDRLLGRTGAHRHTPLALDAPARVADPWARLEAADKLIGELVQQRDEQRDLAVAAAVELEIRDERTRLAEQRADRAERTVTALRAELANAHSVSAPARFSDHKTVETPLPAGAARVRVMPLAEAFGGAR